VDRRYKERNREKLRKYMHEYMPQWIKRNRERWRELQKKSWRKRHPERYCVVCGTKLTGNHSKYCDAFCRRMAYREKNIEYNKKRNLAISHKHPGTHAPETSTRLVNELSGQIRVEGALILKRIPYMRTKNKDVSKTGKGAGR